MTKFDIRVEISNRILQIVEEGGLLPWQKPWDEIHGPPRNAHSGKGYRGANYWLLNMANIGIPVFVTYKQAAEHGGKVTPKQKGLPVSYFSTFEVDDGGVTKKIPMWKHYTVFSLSQCEAVDERWEKFMDKFKPGQFVPTITDAQSIHDRYGMKVIHGGDKAFYRPGTDEIYLPCGSV